MERIFSEIFKETNIGILHYIELVRAWNAILVFVMVLIGFFLVNDSTVNIFPLFLLGLSFAMMYFGAAATNDISDFKTDKINAPYRPLQTNRIKLSQAKLILFFSYAISLLIALGLSFKIFIIAFLTILLSYFYSAEPFNFKNKLFFGTLDLAILTIFLPAYAGLVFFLDDFILDSRIEPLLFLTATFFFIALLKDLKDVFGDNATNKKTFATELGPKKTSLLSIAGLLITIPLTANSFSKFITFDKTIFFLISAIILFFLILLALRGFDPNQNKAETVFTFARIGALFFSLFILISLII